MRYEFNQGGTESMWNNPTGGVETWENEYDVTIFTESGKSYKYDIEADTAGDANDVAREFFTDDYPDEVINGIQIKRK